MNHIMRYIFSFFMLLIGWMAHAQPMPAAAQSEPIVLLGATAHLGNGRVIEQAAIAFEKGRLTFVGKQADWNNNDAYTPINVSGKHLYPGFIAANTRLGLVEIGAVRATRDFDETGTYNPNVRSLIAYNTDSQIIPTVRSNGVLLAQATPDGGRISGTSSIVQLDAWNWEDAAYLADDGIHLNWPSQYRFNWRQGMMIKNEGYQEQIDELKAFFEQAAAYAKGQQPAVKNLRFEAMKGLFGGNQRLFVHVDEAKEILEAIAFLKTFDLAVVIVGGREAYLVPEFLKEAKVPVIFQATQSLPNRSDRPVDEPFRAPAILAQAGVPFCLSISDGSWELRNLPFQAGQAVGYGLQYEMAVQALTGSAAEIMGIADRTGTLEVGKDANLFVSLGDALDMRTCIVEQAYIQGREIDLDNKQKALYRKYQEKYSRQE